jgi:hypothetical protein
MIKVQPAAVIKLINESNDIVKWLLFSQITTQMLNMTLGTSFVLYVMLRSLSPDGLAIYEPQIAEKPAYQTNLREALKRSLSSLFSG